MSKFWDYYKEKLVLLTVLQLFEHYYWQNLLKFYDKKDLSTHIRIIYNIRHGYAIRLKFGGKLLTFLTR